MRTAQQIAGIALLLALLVYPAAADVAGYWYTTAPTTGPAPDGYEWALNVNGGGWADMTDDPDPTDLVYPHTQIAGSVVQCRVIAYRFTRTPVMDAYGLVIGTEDTKVYSDWSILSAPNTVPSDAPHACGPARWVSN